jgi:hypothetical protein
MPHVALLVVLLLGIVGSIAYDSAISLPHVGRGKRPQVWRLEP